MSDSKPAYSQQANFYKLKPEYSGTEYPWPCEREPSRTLQIFADDVLTKAPADSPYAPGTMTKHTGLGCWGIEIPDEHMDGYTGWPHMMLGGRAYGVYHKPQKIESQQNGTSGETK